MNENGEIEYVRFEENFEGIIKSQLFHHKDSFEDVYPIWRDYGQYFRSQNQ